MLEFDTEEIVPKRTISGLVIKVFKENENVLFRCWKKHFFPLGLKCVRVRQRFWLLGKWKLNEVSIGHRIVSVHGNSFRMNEIIKDGNFIWTRLHSNWDHRINLKSVKIKENHLAFRVPKGMICVSVRTREGEHGKIRWILLPNKIKWKNSIFLNALGLFIAEGHLSKRKEGSLSHVAFSNSDFNLLKIWLKFLEKLFPIDRLEWFFNTIMEEEKRNFWKKKTVNELHLNFKLFKDWESKSKSKDGFPVIRVFTCCIILRSIVENLLAIAIRMSRKDRRNAIEFIKGWWAGDGSIIGRKNVIDHLMIRSKEHQLLAKELFEVCGIKTGISKDSVFTCDGILGVKDFIKLGFMSLRSK